MALIAYIFPLTTQPLFKPHFPFIFISHFILLVSETPFSFQVCSSSSPAKAKIRGAHSYWPRVRQSPTPPTETSTPGATDVASPSSSAVGAYPAAATGAGPSVPAVRSSAAAAASPALAVVQGTAVADAEGSSSLAPA